MMVYALNRHVNHNIPRVPQNTYPVHTEHCQWSVLYREISTVMSMHYRYVGVGFARVRPQVHVHAHTPNFSFWFPYRNVSVEPLGINPGEQLCE